MPYISKAKRIKLLCKNTNKEIISEDLRQDDHTLLFKNARTLSPSNNFSYRAPKRRLSQTTAHKGCINRISWNPCYQNHLLSASMDSLLKIWNTESAVVTCIKLVHCHSLAIKDARWCLDGMKILSASYDKSSKITDVNNEKEVCSHNHASFVTCVVCHPFDPNMYLSGTSNHGIYSWDVRMQQYTCRYQSFFGQIQDLVFIPDGKSFISAAEVSRRNSTDKGIMVWDYKTSTVLSNQIYQEPYTCTTLKIHPRDATFLAQSNAGYIALFSQKSPYKLNHYKRFEGHNVSGYHIGMDISPDGSLVASGSSNGFLYVYNYSTTKISNTFELSNSQPCMDVAWSLSSPSLLASCDWSGQIYFHR
ncbi:WD repeat-containing protein 25-like [Xenia sp. Carnegie-2017]|uniref:WD repeat-containing protein 25-like n=1 Tax=Xenia sp. Carnegie-2017 TaxID=2897299 RepID=UPI001F04F32B|nr:WD repeat-containing protein 25-like [Xenia sp. Carnegie-2017]